MTSADEVVVLDFADERSVVQTRFATTALDAAPRPPRRGHRRRSAARGDRRSPSRCPKACWTAPSSPSSAGAGRCGLANEAALKMKEASLSWTESYPAMEYRHGPISITDDQSRRVGPGSAAARPARRRHASRCAACTSPRETRWPT